MCLTGFCSALIDYTSDDDAETWTGWFLACSLFVVAFVQSMILHQYFHRCFLVGMHVRTAVISSVYRKVSARAHRRHLVRLQEGE